MFKEIYNIYDSTRDIRIVQIQNQTGDLQTITATFDNTLEDWDNLPEGKLIDKCIEWFYRQFMLGKFVNEAVDLAEKKAKEAKEDAERISEARKLIEELNEASTEVKETLATVRKEIAEFKAVFVKSTELSQEDKDLLIKQFDSYQPNHEYKVDDILNFEGILYKVVQAHRSQVDWRPDNTASLYTPYLTPKTTDGKEVVNEYKQPTGAHDAYKKGDKVLFNGDVYESLVDANVYPPTDYPKNWNKMGLGKKSHKNIAG